MVIGNDWRDYIIIPVTITILIILCLYVMWPAFIWMIDSEVKQELRNSHGTVDREIN